MLFSTSEGREVKPPHNTLFKGFGNLWLQGQGDPRGACWSGEDPHSLGLFLPRACGSGGPSTSQQGWVNLPADND